MKRVEAGSCVTLMQVREYRTDLTRSLFTVPYGSGWRGFGLIIHRYNNLSHPSFHTSSQVTYLQLLSLFEAVHFVKEGQVGHRQSKQTPANFNLF
jgi:hypothetical protein